MRASWRPCSAPAERVIAAQARSMMRKFTRTCKARCTTRGNGRHRLWRAPSPASRSVLTLGRDDETISARWRRAPGSSRALCLSTASWSLRRASLPGRRALTAESRAGHRESPHAAHADFGRHAILGIARIACVDRARTPRPAVRRCTDAVRRTLLRARRAGANDRAGFCFCYVNQYVRTDHPKRPGSLSRRIAEAFASPNCNSVLQSSARTQSRPMNSHD
jgi:hypothetical protein